MHMHAVSLFIENMKLSVKTGLLRTGPCGLCFIEIVYMHEVREPKENESRIFKEGNVFVFGKDLRLSHFHLSRVHNVVRYAYSSACKRV